VTSNELSLVARPRNVQWGVMVRRCPSGASMGFGGETGVDSPVPRDTIVRQLFPWRSIRLHCLRQIQFGCEQGEHYEGQESMLGIGSYSHGIVLSKVAIYDHIRIQRLCVDVPDIITLDSIDRVFKGDLIPCSTRS
jgi:hypothetical protein